MYFKNTAKMLFSLVLLSCAVHQAFSLQCYECTSTKDGECNTNPKQEKHVRSCTASLPSFTSQLTNSLSDVIPNSMLSQISSTANDLAKNNMELACIKIDQPDTNLVMRACGLCESLAIVPNLKCTSCHKDLCNSSNNLSIGLWTLIASIMSVFVIKF